MQRGFSLVELIVIMVLIGILAVYAIPRKSSDLTANTAATELVQAIRFTQQQSMDKTGSGAASIVLSSDGFTFVNVDTLTTSWRLLKPSPQYSVTISPTGTITFDGHGVPTCTPAGFNCSTSVRSITVTANGSGNSVSLYLEPYTGYVHK